MSETDSVEESFWENVNARNFSIFYFRPRSGLHFSILGNCWDFLTVGPGKSKVMVQGSFLITAPYLLVIFI